MIATDLENRTPEDIQHQIAQTRRALDDKLERLGERLDPRVRLQELKGGLSARAPQYTAWAAVGAIAAGAWLAVRGWRACRNTDLYVSLDHPAIDQTYGMSSSGSEGIF